MTTYYEILGIKPDTAREEVKTAFRARAKECHPDFHPQRSEWAHNRMQEILRAYEVLIDDEKRAVYDRTLSHISSLRGVSRREALRRKGDDPAACCQLVFLDLLEGRGVEALALYERLLKSSESFSLSLYMPLGDALDCEFLLAEEYERQYKIELAFMHYCSLCRIDKRYNYFKRFREEILLRVRNIVVRFLEMRGHLHLALQGFSEILVEEVNRRERAFLYKKFAECFIEHGDEALARLNLLAALQAHPLMSGVKKIRKRLLLNRPLLFS